MFANKLAKAQLHRLLVPTVRTNFININQTVAFRVMQPRPTILTNWVSMRHFSQLNIEWDFDSYQFDDQYDSNQSEERDLTLVEDVYILKDEDTGKYKLRDCVPAQIEDFRIFLETTYNPILEESETQKITLAETRTDEKINQIHYQN